MTSKNLKKIISNLDLYLFCLPGIIITVLFSYVPLYGLQIAFRNFSPRKGVWGSPWVGFDQFTRFFESAQFGEILTNTLILSIYGLIASFPIPIILALMLNSFRHKRYRKVIQSVTYAPHFISTVVMCGMLLLFLSPRIGIVNNVVQMFGGDPINFMGEAKYWRHLYVWSGVWQGMGWSSVIYFAALSGVSPEFHEAATVDGATKLQRVLYIDLPALAPVMTISLILSCGSILSVGFEKVYLLQNPLNTQVSEIISTYVYKVGMLDNNISFSTAIGLFNSVINAILLIGVNWFSGKVSENSLW